MRFNRLSLERRGRFMQLQAYYHARVAYESHLYLRERHAGVGSNLVGAKARSADESRKHVIKP